VHHQLSGRSTGLIWSFELNNPSKQVQPTSNQPQGDTWLQGILSIHSVFGWGKLERWKKRGWESSWWRSIFHPSPPKTTIANCEENLTQKINIYNSTRIIILPQLITVSIFCYFYNFFNT
jgi:hypothetical protein